MGGLKSFFVFKRKQRNGIIGLLLVIIIIQVLYFTVEFSNEKIYDVFSEEIVLLQQKTDSLKQISSAEHLIKYSFNPNYIDDHRGYTLGMSVEEIDRLHRYRASGKWVNSAEDFQRVTGVSDSLLSEIKPLFKFPEWVNSSSKQRSYATTFSKEKSFSQKKNLNTATAEELREIRGVGEVLSKRIISYREHLKGFIIDEQLYDVYGLESSVAQNIMKEYTVKETPVIEKININTASSSDMSTLPLISFQLAKEIVDYRILHNGFTDLEQLKNVKGFPVSKYDRFTLYLTLD